ncbi:MAG: 3-phosphoshikimate 1-carboxyvinyltransferase [Opitutales bacterium]|nr:3-phosphoshikimate 1-carboxyvinyltransferase [Opitutales bacterium]
MIQDPLPIRPFSKSPEATVSVPGSKSLTNRALLLAALCPGKTTLSGALFSRDTRIMLQALQALGFAAEGDDAEARITVEGCGGSIPKAEATLHVGNAGTAARFLSAFVCLHPAGCYTFEADEAMYRRPVAGLTDTLTEQGATFEWLGEPGCFPFKVKTAGLKGGDMAVDASASSQLLSALLLVAPFTEAPARVCLSGTTVSHPFVEMTVRLLGQFGVPVNPQESGVYGFEADVRPGLSESEFAIEPDATAASYFLALPLAVGGSIEVRGLKQEMLQGDIRFVDVLKKTGLKLEWTENGLRSTFQDQAEPVDFDFNAVSDTFLTLAALTPLLRGPSTLKGIGHTRHQETDRIAAVATELLKMGQVVEETEDSLTVDPSYPELHLRSEAARAVGRPCRVKTYEDHRVAMSFAILGCHNLMEDGEPWLYIMDPGCCGKTFPNFFEVLESIHPQ